jgi:CIC family chloride channel protein
LVRSRASALIARAHGWGLAGFLTVVVTLSVLVAFAAWLVRRVAPYASGSGIPDVEAVLSERTLPPPFWRLFPVKFVGGVLAIGSGLALGREGPSVQMGGNAANFVAELSRRNRSDSRALIAAGAGAGLAAAFNAPLAGVIFVLEELYKRFEISIALAALGASTTAIVVSRLILGDAPDYQVAPIAFVVDSVKPLFCLFGLLAGLLAVVYNIMLLGALSIADRFAHVPVELRAGLVGAAVGVLAWFAPAIVGGGDSITQSVLNGAGSLALLPLLYAIRLVLSTVSYATGTPGGLFAPMLVLGAQSGLFFGLLANAMFPSIGVQPESFAVVGMAALFTGIVRAPLTGIVLTMEMTANFTLLLPMLAACFVAMLIPTLLGNPPIYDSLRERALSRQDRDSPSDA